MKGFSESQLQERGDRTLEFVRQKKLEGYFIFNPYNIFYMGLYYYPGKRPVVLYIHCSGKVYAFTPKMEYHEALKAKVFDEVYAYDDDFSAQRDLYDFIREHIPTPSSPRKGVGVDTVNLEGYRRLEEIFGKVYRVDQVLCQRQIKSPEEVAMLRKSAYYSDYIVQKGKEILEPGITELGLLNRSITKTVDKMIEEMGEVVYVPGGPAGGLVPSGIRTAIPHALPSGKVVEKGDTMILSCGTNVWGYRTECERTFFVGEPGPRKKEAFQVMAAAQALGIQLMKPGAVCEEIERKVIQFISEAGYGQYMKHRTGHGKGLEEHEPPYIAAGDPTLLQPGMVFSSEPGIYIEGLSGFRHSDTVVITEEGCEVLTKYPKDIDSMTIRV